MVKFSPLLVLLCLVSVGHSKRKSSKTFRRTFNETAPETSPQKSPQEFSQLFSSSSNKRTETTPPTAEQLLNELRRKQLQGMVAEQDRYLELKVPAELAAAAFNEAERRKLQAESDVFEMNKTPYSPFDADEGLKNIGYLGRGYDILFGNPLDDSGRVDPGFRLPVIQLEYLMNVFTADGEYRMPDNSDIIMEPSALFTSSYSDVRTESDYKEELSKDVKKSAGFGIEGGGIKVAGEFSQSKSYQNAKERIKKGGRVNIDIIGRATVYKATINTFGHEMKVSTLFKKAIASLPVPSADCTDTEMPPFYKLIRDYGTHFTTIVTMGAKAVQRLSMTTAESMELKKKSITTAQVVSASFGFKAKGVDANANYGNEQSTSHETEVSNTLQTMNIQKTEFYIGGEPPSESSTEDDQGSTQSLLEWGKSAQEHPVPIQYELQKIEDLFSKNHLTDIADTASQIASKKKCLVKALSHHCSNVAIDKEDCVTFEDGKGNSDVIRYGDFIAVKTADVVEANIKYLNVPKKPPKFGTGENAQQMKVVPVDATAYWKYGQALHYGEPFNFLSEHGGEQGVVKCTTSRERVRHDLINFGKESVTCASDDVEVGEWTHHPYRWCGDQQATPLAVGIDVQACKVLCLQRTNGECKAIEYDFQRIECYECTDPSQMAELPVGGNSDVYKRVSTGNIPQKPFTVAMLYFTSPLGKKQGSLVMKNDKVHIGISYYDPSKTLYDLQRPSFLKLAGSRNVEVTEDDGETAADLSFNACTVESERSKISHAKRCKFWWKLQANKKILRTYPTVHFDSSTAK